MKKVLLIALSLMVVAVAANAQLGGKIGLYSDQEYTDCFLDETVAGLCPVYVVHTAASAKGAQFKITNSANLNVVGTVFAHSLNNGDPFAGYSVVYDGGCQSPPTLILTVNVFCQNSAAACSEMTIENDPTVADILGLDCANIERVAEGGKLVVNPDGSCPCVITNPVEQRTWGKIKSLYQ